MRRFWGALINEHVKILHKASTKIMAAVIILVALGFNLIMAFAPIISGNNRYYYTESIDQQIASIKNNPYEGSELDLERLQYMKDNGIASFYQDRTDKSAWKTDAVYLLFDQKKIINENNPEVSRMPGIENSIEDLDRAIKTDDWLLYYKTTKQITLYNIGSGDSEQTDSYNWYANYLIDNKIEPWDWRYETAGSIYNAKQQLSTLKKNPQSEENDLYINEAEKTIEINEYRLEKNLQHYTYDGIDNLYFSGSINNLGFHDIFAKTYSLISIIGVLVIIVAGSAISSEFSAGTVKFLLINPVKRWKILVTKYISIITTTLGMLIVLYISNALFAGIFFGFGSANVPYLAYKGGELIVGSSFLFVAGKYLLGSVGMVCVATFAFALSSLTRNTALSVALGVFFAISGSLIVQIAYQMLNLDWIRYLIFANTDLNAIANGGSGIVNHTLTFALINIAVYMVIFILTAWDGFVRRDVK